MGRLGNHFFQYAFAYAAAKELNTSFRIKGLRKSQLPSICALPTSKSTVIQRTKRFPSILVSVFREKLKKKERFSIENYQELVLKDHVTYKGYFQSDQFFSKYESEIRKEFEFQERVSSRFESSYGKLYRQNKILCVHIRRTDYGDAKVDFLGGESLILPSAYYRENILKLLDADTKVIFVSDDIEAVEREFKGDNPNYIFSKEDSIMDFMLLAHAHKMIIANSSFSWWAAYLNQTPDRKVIAPKYYLGFKVDIECPAGIMHKNFTWVNVPKNEEGSD